MAGGQNTEWESCRRGWILWQWHAPDPVPSPGSKLPILSLSLLGLVPIRSRLRSQSCPSGRPVERMHRRHTRPSCCHKRAIKHFAMAQRPCMLEGRLGPLKLVSVAQGQREGWAGTGGGQRQEQVHVFLCQRDLLQLKFPCRMQQSLLPCSKGIELGLCCNTVGSGK